MQSNSPGTTRSPYSLHAGTCVVAHANAAVNRTSLANGARTTKSTIALGIIASAPKCSDHPLSYTARTDPSAADAPSPVAAGAQHSAFTGILANTSPVPVANNPLPNTPSSILACSNAVSGSNDVVFVDARHDASPPRRALPSRRRVASRRRSTVIVPSRARDTRASMARIASTSRARGRTTSGRGLDASSPEGVKPYGTRTPRPSPRRFANLRGTKRRRASDAVVVAHAIGVDSRTHVGTRKACTTAGSVRTTSGRGAGAREPALALALVDETLGRRCPLLDVDGRKWCSRQRHRPSVEMRMT